MTSENVIDIVGIVVGVGIVNGSMGGKDTLGVLDEPCKNGRDEEADAVTVTVGGERGID
jgi:hypothetical protein